MSCGKCNRLNCSGCDPTAAGYNLIGKTLSSYVLKAPIPDEVRDIQKLKNFFRDRKYIPFAGNIQDSNHTHLNFLLRLSRMSPSLASCINGIKFYAFSGKPKIIRSIDSEFDFEDSLNGEELSKEDMGRVLDKLSVIDKGNISWSSLATNLYNSYMTCGNAFLSVDIKKLFDKTFITIRFHNPETVLYKIPDLFVSDKVDVSPSWDSRYLKSNHPKTYSIYPYYDSNKDETEFSTMIHIKNGSDHYGRPSWLPATMDAFLEVKNKEYLLKAVHNNFTGQVLIEFEGAEYSPALSKQQAQEEGWKNEAERWVGNFTNAGAGPDNPNPQTILITERPAGSAPVHVHEFKIDTKEDYFIKIGSEAERKIIQTLMWSKNLSGVDNAGGFSSDAFLSELKVKIPVLIITKI
ncbi:MAG: hypothetical protein HOP11_07485 [Saprospiraceae bacterium]|nr:hypothetical protein [Saprospiraceae bacterium]